MADGILRLDRRRLIAGLGAAALAPARSSAAAAEPQIVPVLHAKIDLGKSPPQRPDALLWEFAGPAETARATAKRGTALEFRLANELPVPAGLNWRGLDGVPSSELLTAQAPLPSGASQNLQIPFGRSGTYLCDLRLLGDGQARASRALMLIVAETEAVEVDHDEVFLIEDFRLDPDGALVAPGSDPKGTNLLYTINRESSQQVSARPHDRLRMRFINGCQRSVIAVKIENHDVRVIALDSQPAEPFPARNGAIVLAPGGRADAFVDAAGPAGMTSAILLHDGKEARSIGRLVITDEPPIRSMPLPPFQALKSDGPRAQLDLKNALRFELVLGGPAADWVTPATLAATTPPAFRARAGRIVVLALANRAGVAIVFHLHGHHFRLLDRLDDGWKPFWLDTLAIGPGQTEHVAFAAEYAGRWLLEAMATDWAAPRLVRWYSVE
jgi:FtsP/CotA-like multicopper oxidase with cupredoxin domain